MRLLSLLLLLNLPHVELKLLPLKDVPISTAHLPGTARDARKKLPALELLLKRRVHLVQTLTPLVLRNHSLALSALLVCRRLRPLLVHVHTVVLQVPLTEGRRVDLHNRVPHKRVRAHKLVVGRVVHNIQNPSPRRNPLCGPRKVPGLKTQRTALDEPIPATHKVDHLRPNAGHSWLPPDLKLSLLPVRFPLPAGRTVLVDRVACDRHSSVCVSVS